MPSFWTAWRAWNRFQRAYLASPTYREAMADGLLALQALVPDLDTGPRVAAVQPGACRQAQQAFAGPPQKGLKDRSSFFSYSAA